VEHVFEDWSAYSSPSQIATTNRADGGGPWLNDGAAFQTLSTTDLDPWFGRKRLSINLQDAPGAGSALQRGFILRQSGSPPPYRNTASTQASLVIEWAWKYTGTKPYEGKVVDFQNGIRYNYQTPGSDPLGLQLQSNCDNDGLCSKYYSNNGQVPRVPNIQPTKNYIGEELVYSRAGLPNGNDVIFYRQNRGYPAVNWPGSGYFVDNTWYRTILRYSHETAGPGTGRIEAWLQRAGQAAVKVMDFRGEPGQFDAGWVYTQTGNWLPSGTDFKWYHLTAVFDNYAGGNTTHLGYLRIWSHPRSELL
jgi:hypothetical protein